MHLHLQCVLALIAMSMLVVVDAIGYCDSYTVSLTQKDFIRNEPITFLCTYNSSTHDAIEWREADNSAEGFESMFFEYISYPEMSNSRGAYADRLKASISAGAHALTVYNASEADDFRFWQCTVNTWNCSSGVSDIQPIRYASK